MSTELATQPHVTKEKQLEAGTWGVFFLWIGIAFLTHLPWGVWLLGVGIILIGAQLARRMFGLGIDGFWMVAGVLLLLGGISDIAPFGIHIAIIPVLCIIAGIVLIARALSRHGGAARAT